MRVIVKRWDEDVLVRAMDDTDICSPEHEIGTVLRIHNYTMRVPHFICNVPDDTKIWQMKMIIFAFAAGLESAHANSISDFRRVEICSRELEINLSPFYGCN